MVYEQVLTVAVGAAGAVAFIALYSGGGDGRLWLLALLPLGLILLTPRFFGPATAWVLQRFKREPLPRLLATRILMALVGWYTPHRGRPRHGDLAPGAVGGGQPGGPPRPSWAWPSCSPSPSGS